MRTENPYFQRFPNIIIPESNHTPVWSGQRDSAPNSDVRIKRQSRPYWVSDLSDCVLTEPLKDQIIAMVWRNGGTRPVLNRIPMFCEIGTIVDRDWNGEPIVEPQVIGVGNGTQQTFQLRKRLLVTGYENEYIYYNVRYPHWNYPDQMGLVKTSSGVTYYNLMPELTIYLNGVPLAQNLWSVDRNTGLVTLSQTGNISASGGFYILQLMPKIPMTSVGSNYKIKSGVSLEEPAGGR